MSSKLKRVPSTYELTITNSLATSEAINFEDEACMTIYTPAAWTSCNVTVYALSPVSGVGYLALVDQAGNTVTFTAAASSAITLTDAIFACTHLKLVSDQAANNALTVGASSKA